MVSLRCIAYVSTAVKPMSEAELEALLVEVRGLNQESGITGVLLYSDGTFFQYFEGTEPAMQLTFRRIQDSRQHTGIFELMHQPTSERCFSDWQMGFAHAKQSEVLALSTAKWHQRALASAASSTSAGVALLLDFWSRAAS